MRRSGIMGTTESKNWAVGRCLIESMDQREFAIFRWSSKKYAPDEWMFPGSEFVDGTIEGAM